MFRGGKGDGYLISGGCPSYWFSLVQGSKVQRRVTGGVISISHWMMRSDCVLQGLVISPSRLEWAKVCEHPLPSKYSFSLTSYHFTSQRRRRDWGHFDRERAFLACIHDPLPLLQLSACRSPLIATVPLHFPWCMDGSLFVMVDQTLPLSYNDRWLSWRC